MKRIGAKLFGGLAVTSLVLCAGSMVCWLESEFVNDWGFRADSSSQFMIDSGAGEISFTYFAIRVGDGPPKPEIHVGHVGQAISEGWQMLRAAGGTPQAWDRMGFHFLYRARAPEWLGAATLVSFPFWFVGVVFSILPLVWVKRKWSQRRRPGICRRCGYDLRATPGRCPECGEVVVTLARTD